MIDSHETHLQLHEQAVYPWKTSAVSFMVAYPAWPRVGQDLPLDARINRRAYEQAIWNHLQEHARFVNS